MTAPQAAAQRVTPARPGPGQVTATPAIAFLGTGRMGAPMATVGAEWTVLARLADAHGVVFIDAPVSGSEGPARAGQLTILASGPDQVRDILAPVFAALGRATVWLGPAGNGTRAKLVLNNWLADLTESTAETLAFARRLGLDPAVVVDLLQASPLGSPYAVQKAHAILAGDFTPAFALKHAIKDAELAVQAARASGAELTLTGALLPRWQSAADSGHADDDLAAVYTASDQPGTERPGSGSRPEIQRGVHDGTAVGVEVDDGAVCLPVRVRGGVGGEPVLAQRRGGGHHRGGVRQVEDELVEPIRPVALSAGSWPVDDRRLSWPDSGRTFRSVGLLDEGRTRIFDRGRDDWDGTWRMVIYQVPEESRAERDRVRRTLPWHGFGPLATAIVPEPGLITAPG